MPDGHEIRRTDLEPRVHGGDGKARGGEINVFRGREMLDELR